MSLSVFDSVVALSAQRGGSTKFHREDLVVELQWEAREIERRLRLDSLDKEFHDACATRKGAPQYAIPMYELNTLMT